MISALPDRAAKAALPTVMITGFAGASNAVVSRQTFGPFQLFQAVPAITLLPIHAGRLSPGGSRRAHPGSRGRYQQAIQGAVRGRGFLVEVGSGRRSAKR
jgi:hypothetical protein